MHKFLPVGFYYKTLIKPRWLWPKVEPMIRKVAGLGRVDMSDLPRHLERVYRHPDVVVLGAGPAGLAAALGAAEAGASVIVADEGEHPGSRLGHGATLDAVRELLPQVEAQRAHRAAARAPRVRPLRGPRGAADRARPARDDAAEGDRRRDRRVRVDGGLPRQRRARRDARPRRRAPRDAARDQARQRRRRSSAARTRSPSTSPRCRRSAPRSPRSSCPTAPTSAPELPAGVRTIVGEIVAGARQEARRAPSASATRAAPRRSRATCSASPAASRRRRTCCARARRCRCTPPATCSPPARSPSRSPTRARSARAPRAARAPSCPSSARRPGAAATTATSASARTSRCRTCATP